MEIHLDNKCNRCGKELTYWGTNEVSGVKLCNNCFLEEFEDKGTRSLVMQEYEQNKIKDHKEKKLKAKEETKALLVSSLLSLDNKKTVKYFDMIASSVVMGTGIFSEFNAATSDFFGVRSDGFENKLHQAKQIALSELKKQAFDLGANAVLGADIDYMEVGKNMLMVTISGTPVIVQDDNIK